MIGMWRWTGWTGGVDYFHFHVTDEQSSIGEQFRFQRDIGDWGYMTIATASNFLSPFYLHSLDKVAS